MNLSRRTLLKAGLGATQMGLLGKLALAPRAARAAVTDAPTRLLTLFLPGGAFQQGFFCPMTTQEINWSIPRQSLYGSDPVNFNAEQVSNLDGSGDAPGDGGFLRIRTPRQWDDAALSA